MRSFSRLARLAMLVALALVVAQIYQPLLRSALQLSLYYLYRSAPTYPVGLDVVKSSAFGVVWTLAWLTLAAMFLTLAWYSKRELRAVLAR